MSGQQCITRQPDIRKMAMSSTLNCPVLQIVCMSPVSRVSSVLGVQVLAQYAQYADKAVGQFGTKPDGTPAPGVRVVLKPLLALFHGEKGCKLWKRALDAGMKTPASASQLIKVGYLPACGISALNLK